MSVIGILIFWLLGAVVGYFVGRLHSLDREGEALDQIAKALDRHDWELGKWPLDDREYMIVGDPPRPL